MDGIRNVLLDIEGTICPIAFVKETLFPYALKALPEVLQQKWEDSDFQPYIIAFPAAARESPETLQAAVEDLTRRDVKVACLKNLQGYLWQEGYETKAYSTPLFPDVPPKLQQWHSDGVKISIYSSGSVFAQKLLFANVADDAGQGAGQRDMTGLISGWFDTTNAGFKAEASSYGKIAAALEWLPRETLFLSDNVHEVDAAIEAGMKSLLVDRQGNAPVSELDRRRLPVIESFADIA